MANPMYGQNKYDDSRDDSVTIKASGSISNAGVASWIPNPDNQSFGIYEAVYELSFGATTGGNTSITTTDNGLIKTVATVPANAFFLDAKILTSEVFDSDDEKGMDLAVCSTTPAAADDAMTATALVITAAEMKSSASGALNSLVGSVFSSTTASSVVAGGAGTHLCLINTDGSNAADAIQTGKVIVYIKYAGSAAPVANTTV
jgi:hypothetical protein